VGKRVIRALNGSDVAKGNQKCCSLSREKAESGARDVKWDVEPCTIHRTVIYVSAWSGEKFLWGIWPQWSPGKLYRHAKKASVPLNQRKSAETKTGVCLSCPWRIRSSHSFHSFSYGGPIH